MKSMVLIRARLYTLMILFLIAMAFVFYACYLQNVMLLMVCGAMATCMFVGMFYTTEQLSAKNR